MKPLTDTEICEEYAITQAELERRREWAKDTNAAIAERKCGITREDYDKLTMVPISVCSWCGTLIEVHVQIREYLAEDKDEDDDKDADWWKHTGEMND